jgi:Amt family ammonium transporter
MSQDLSGATSFLIVSSALVLYVPYFLPSLMTPAVGLLYSGLSNSKDALNIFMLSMLSYIVVSIQWVLFGFSLSFSETGSSIIGDLSHAGMVSIGLKPLMLTAPQVPSIAFALYQLQFATITVAIIVSLCVPYSSLVERQGVLKFFLQ